MKRRGLLAGLGGVAVSTALAPAARAGISCTGFYNGVQQCQVGLSTSVAERRAQRQRASQWCWAASLSMVFAYHGHAVSQERIVREAYGRLVDMPAQPQLMVAALNRTWRDDDDEDFTSRGDVFSANPMTAARDLAEDEPLIIGTSHHAMVLTALTYLRDQRGNGQVVAATVRDPWPDNPSRRAMSPQEWADVHFLARVRID